MLSLTVCMILLLNCRDLRDFKETKEIEIEKEKEKEMEKQVKP